MNKKPVITSVQLVLMTVGSALVFPYTFMPILNTPPANQDVWVVLLLALVYIVLLNAPLLFLMNKFRGMTVPETSEAVLGKFLGKAILIPFVLFFLYCYCACMMIVVKFVQTYILGETPTWALALIMIIPAGYAAYKGAGTIGRLSVFFISFSILTIIFFFVIGIKAMDIRELKPVLADSTFLEINKGAFLTAARFSEIFIFWIFSFYLSKKASINKSYAAALIIYVASFLMMLLPIILVLGAEFAKKLQSPYYTYARQAEVFTFLERVQAINSLARFPGALLKLALYNFMASSFFSSIVKAKSHKYFVFAVSAIGLIVCFLPIMNQAGTIETLRSDQVFPWVTLPVIVVLPAIIVAVYILRRRKVNKKILEAQEKNCSEA